MGDHLARIQTIDLDESFLPIRPDYGDQSIRNKVPLWTNYFKMALHKPNLVLYLYDLSFEVIPRDESEQTEKELTVPKGKKLMQLIRCALHTSTFNEVRSDIATDFGKALISCKKLENSQMQTGQFQFWAENEIENEKPKPRTNAIRFQMTLKDNCQFLVSDLVNYLPSSTNSEGAYEKTLPIVQALDIILGHYGKLSLDVVTPKRGKCFPKEPENTEKFSLGSPGYLQGVRGFFASVRATTKDTLVNCNACCGAFYKPIPLEALFAIFIPSPNPSTEQLKRLEKAIQGLRVELTHLKDDKGQPMPSLRTIFGLERSYRGPREVEFYHKKEEKTYTIATY